MSSKKILMVDDDAFIRDYLGEFLKFYGFEIVKASTGVEALSIYQAEEFNLIISDMSMPEMDGIQLIRELKTNYHCKIPILFLTANDKVDTAVEAMRLGATDYIFKEENIQETILLAVNRAIQEQEIEFERRRLAEKNTQLVADLRIKNSELENFNQKNMELLDQLQCLNEELEDRIRKATFDLRSVNEQLNQRLAELSALYEVSQAVSSVMNLGELLDLVMAKSKEVMKAEASSLMLLNQQKSHLIFYVAKGEKKNALKSIDVPVDDNSISGWVAKNAKPLLIPDAYKDARFNPEYDKKTGFRTTSALCVPLLNKEAVIGIVMVLNHIKRRAFNETDLNTFTAFANQATIAIENARLYEVQKQTADELRDALERERRITIEKEKMGKYIPQDLIDDIQKNREEKLALGGKSVSATILFSDIQGFTRISEEVEPQRVIDFLNQYMTEMTDLIEKYDGVLDKFIGDGIMAVFIDRNLTGTNHHALRAVKAGIAMQMSCRQITRSWEERKFGSLNIRIGINSGNVVSGNIGSEKRMDYTVIGDNVNLSSRLEAACPVGQILISDSTYRMIQGRVKVKKINVITVKNRKQPVQPFVVDPTENNVLCDP
ncbi:MAG: hypothetical protein B6244_02105 [Candidatus Cloacimonetes bacterium 4572_55]|nr:MAG: hypothetical protein B6244_02105 [Candidatus Cloacimonetes bacterium 4572_55]